MDAGGIVDFILARVRRDMVNASRERDEREGPSDEMCEDDRSHSIAERPNVPRGSIPPDVSQRLFDCQPLETPNRLTYMSNSPVIITARQLKKGAPLPAPSALESMTEGVSEDAEAEAALYKVLANLSDAQSEAGSDQVMLTARDQLTSLVQSAMAEANGPLQPLPSGGLEAMFDTHDILGWAKVGIAKLRNLIPHELVKPASDEAHPFPDQGRVGLLGDWGTGLYGAPVIADTIMKKKDAEPYAMLMHLGDVYYAGSDKETQERFLKLWPNLPGTIMRALNGNHEMYSGGHAYFTSVLPKFGQDASYFALQNSHWTLIGLDVAHKDHAINENTRHRDEQLNWLKGILARAGNRKVIFFSHHQLFSQYESQGDKLWAEPAFADILKSHRVFAWYWGHEHRCCIYENPDPRSGILGRCLGHGGMPQSRSLTINLPRAAEYKDADWRRVAAKTDDNGHAIPQALVLEGRNPYLGDEAEKFSPHGFGTLIFDGPGLVEQVRDCTGSVIYEKRLAS